ncbi:MULTISPECIES: ATP-binding protein [Falsihalocynthiibacter]|uniref:ATP-binding protein n=1 Tax=Falsihalocynthiibacter TaxID=2854182 RepID=UPI0030027C01
MQHISITLPGNALAVRSALENILEQLMAFGFSGENCSVTELVLAEVMNNIVEHAYANGDPGPILISISAKGLDLSIEIIDHGDPMPHYSLPQATQTNLDCALDDLPEGGWGWLIIHEIAENLVYNRIGASNHLSFQLSSNRAFNAPK